jgi:hypothetical protein
MEEGERYTGRGKWLRIEKTVVSDCARWVGKHMMSTFYISI